MTALALALYALGVALDRRTTRGQWPVSLLWPVFALYIVLTSARFACVVAARVVRRGAS